MSLKARITEDMKTALKSRETVRLGAIRLLLAAIKQKEVDERIEVDDTLVVAIIEKMARQRKESLSQFEAAGREDLAGREREELAILEAYLPEKMGEAEILALIDAAIATTGARQPADMGKLMGVLKPRLAGKADMALVSRLVKSRLAQHDS
ncbi:MAG: GatB/YqeY domain-containing protein [Zoogloeaceae bacterium]|nr:GatB/YqeY domain-containing protein [Zoogloeaceae bacterium]